MNDTQRITCTACQVEIIGSEQRRIHYRSDLHLVNLKRKVGGLGPLTQAEFSRRVAVLTQSRQENGTDNGNNDNDENIANQSKRANKRRREKTVCEICRKTFSSRQAFLNHEKSKRHIDMLNRQDTDMSEISSNTIPSVISTARGNNNLDREGEEWAWAEDDDDDELAVDEELQRRMQGWDDNDSDKRNVFDDNQPKCKNALAALDQMWKTHGFFVPHKEYLTDPEGLVRYLAQKVLIGYACIACDKGFRSVEDVRKHMKDVGHCRMTSNEHAFLEEYDEFYTWTTSAKEKSEDDDDEQWQQVDDDDNEDLEVNDNVVMIHPDHDDRSTLIDNTPVGRLRTHSHEENQPDVDAENIYALTLGNKTIGHRSLARYYKQAGGSSGDTRDAVVASLSAAEMRVSAWRAERKRMTMTQANGQSFALRRRQCFELSVGSSNYYVRKSKLRQNMAVLNSGYRA